MVIFVTKTSCPRREMTTLALTVCAHIAATLYPPQFWPLIIGFCPFKPDAQPSICPTLYLAGGGGDGKGDGVGFGGYAICLAGCGGAGKRDGDGSGGRALCLRPRRWWGQWEVSCAGPQRCRGQSARKPARTLAHSLATP